MALKAVDYINEMGFQRDDFADFLPYHAYDPKNECYVADSDDDRYIGFIWECSPPPFATEDQIKSIEAVLNSTLPEEAIIQFILYADPNVSHILRRFVEMREEAAAEKKKKKIGEIMIEEGILTPEQVNAILEEQKISGEPFGKIAERLGFASYFSIRKALESQKGFSVVWAKKYAQFLEKHTKTGFYEDVPVPLRNFRLFFCLKLPLENYSKDIEKYLPHRNEVEGLLETSYFNPERLSPEELINFLRGVLNYGIRVNRVEYDPDVPIKYQILSRETGIEWNRGIKKGAFRINGKEISVLSVARFPRKVDIYDNLYLIGDIMRENLRQVLCPFILCVTYRHASRNSFVERWAQMVISQKAFGGTYGAKVYAKQKEADQATYLMSEHRTQFKDFMTSMILFTDTPTDKERITSTVKAIWKQFGYDLQEEALYPLPMFLASLPFGIKNNKESIRYFERKRFTVAPAESIAETCPVQADWRGIGEPVMLFVSRRGQLISFDPFSGSQTNYNISIFAQSRAGKSFLVNYIIACYHSLNARIWVIDIGRSYQKLCRFLKGKYLEFTTKSNICLNPFSNMTDINENLDMLTALLERMAKPKEGCSDLERTILKEKIQMAWEKYGQDTTITRIADMLSQGGELERNLSKLLLPYTAAGEYKRWFEGKANVDFGDSQFMVLELEELSGDTNLRNVILLLVIYQIQQQLYFNRNQRKLVIIDEAWQFFKDEAAGTARFIENGFRRAAKYLGAFVVITQNILDFYRSEDVGRAILDNSEFWFIMKQNPENLEQVVKEGKLSLGKFMLEYVKSVHTVKGKYSEVFIKSGSGSGIARLFVDDFSYALFTTDGEKVSFLEEKLNEGYSLEDAINLAIKTNYGGKALGHRKHVKTRKEEALEELSALFDTMDDEDIDEVVKIARRNAELSKFLKESS